MPKREGSAGKVSTLEYDIVNALYIETGRYISISVGDGDDLDEAEKDELRKAHIDLSKKYYRFTPEDVAIIHDLMERMSPEAREVLETLFKPTPDQLKIIGSKVQGRVNRKRLVKYIESFYEVSIDKVLKEIRNVLRSILEVREKP